MKKIVSLCTILSIILFNTSPCFASWGSGYKYVDAGVDTAAKNGNIEKISHIDVNELTVFFFFRKLTVTVYGE